MRPVQSTSLTALALAWCLLQLFVGSAVGEVDVARPWPDAGKGRWRSRAPGTCRRIRLDRRE